MVAAANIEKHSSRVLRSGFVALMLLLLCAASVSPALAARGAKEFAATLSASERKLFNDWLAADVTHGFKVDAYWRRVVDKRNKRRRKRASGNAVYSVKDYVTDYPPVYKGPKLTRKLAKRWAAFTAKKKKDRPPPKRRPGLADFLKHAKAQFGFVPERIPEREFKVRYAREALALGLTKDQVVRIYALETSGLGTADMVAGIHPIKKTGKPISTAIGYAQLLAANSVSELVTSGPVFIARLKRMARGASPERAAKLNAKISALRKMTAAAKSVPNKWSRHMSYARTSKGKGIHAINLDGDIGPWLQVIKIKGLKEYAKKQGIFRLAGNEIELMNLAGPATALEMMRPAGLKVPTTNFFSRNGYYRNTVVRGKTSAELLVALDKRMDTNIRNSGAVEFAKVFDQVAAERRASR